MCCTLIQLLLLLLLLSHPFSPSHPAQEGRWVIYNDEKVAASEHPPLGLGYMYVYQRTV
jgi:hypothetical protein